MRIRGKGRDIGPAALLTVVLATALGTPAQADPPARTWAAPTTVNADGQELVETSSAFTRPGESVAVFNVHKSPNTPAVWAAVKEAGQPYAPPQQLSTYESFWPTVAGDGVGGAVAIWYDEATPAIQVAEKPAGATQFSKPIPYDAIGGDYSDGRPRLAMNARGDAIVVLLRRDSQGGQRVWAAVRPAGGSFGPAEPVTPDSPDGAHQIARSVALSPTGTAIVGLQHNGTPHAAIRPPGGPFELDQALGEPSRGFGWHTPKVGIDAGGAAAAAWIEGGGTNEASAVKVAFKPAGATSFGEPIDAGQTTVDYNRFDLGVSAVGELVLSFDAQGNNPNGGTTIYGIAAGYGNVETGRMGPMVLLSNWPASDSTMTMNDRGDAVVAWWRCCDGGMGLIARRRPPGGAFLPEEQVAGPLKFEGSRGGWVADEVDVDPFGNASTLWRDFEVDKTYLSEDAPAILDEPPAIQLPDVLPPVLPLPDVPRGPDVPPLPPIGPPPFGDVQAAAQANHPFKPGTATDHSPPQLTIRPARALSGRSALVRVSCSEACDFRVGGKVRVQGMQRVLGLRPVEASLRRRGRMRVGITLPRRAVRALSRSQRRSARLSLWTVAADATGNAVRARAAVKIRR